MSFYETENLENFRVEDIPTPNDVKQSLATAKNGPQSLTTAQRDNLTASDYFKVGAVIYNSSLAKFQGYNGSTWDALN